MIFLRLEKSAIHAKTRTIWKHVSPFVRDHCNRGLNQFKNVQMDTSCHKTVIFFGDHHRCKYFCMLWENKWYDLQSPKKQTVRKIGDLRFVWGACTLYCHEILRGLKIVVISSVGVVVGTSKCLQSSQSRQNPHPSMKTALSQRIPCSLFPGGSSTGFTDAQEHQTTSFFEVERDALENTLFGVDAPMVCDQMPIAVFSSF